MDTANSSIYERWRKLGAAKPYPESGPPDQQSTYTKCLGLFGSPPPSENPSSSAIFPLAGSHYPASVQAADGQDGCAQSVLFASRPANYGSPRKSRLDPVRVAQLFGVPNPVASRELDPVPTEDVYRERARARVNLQREVFTLSIGGKGKEKKVEQDNKETQTEDKTMMSEEVQCDPVVEIREEKAEVAVTLPEIPVQLPAEEAAQEIRKDLQKEEPMLLVHEESVSRPVNNDLVLALASISKSCIAKEEKKAEEEAKSMCDNQWPPLPCEVVESVVPQEPHKVHVPEIPIVTCMETVSEPEVRKEAFSPPSVETVQAPMLAVTVPEEEKKIDKPEVPISPLPGPTVVAAAEASPHNDLLSPAVPPEEQKLDESHQVPIPTASEPLLPAPPADAHTRKSRKRNGIGPVLLPPEEEKAFNPEPSILPAPEGMHNDNSAVAQPMFLVPHEEREPVEEPAKTHMAPPEDLMLPSANPSFLGDKFAYALAAEMQDHNGALNDSQDAIVVEDSKSQAAPMQGKGENERSKITVDEELEKELQDIMESSKEPETQLFSSGTSKRSDENVTMHSTAEKLTLPKPECPAEKRLPKPEEYPDLLMPYQVKQLMDDPGEADSVSSNSDEADEEIQRLLMESPDSLPFARCMAILDNQLE